MVRRPPLCIVCIYLLPVSSVAPELNLCAHTVYCSMYYAGYIFIKCTIHGQETTFMYCMFLFLSRDHFIKFHVCLGVIVFNYVYLSPDSKVPVEQTFIHMNVFTCIYLILHNVHVTVMS